MQFYANDVIRSHEDKIEPRMTMTHKGFTATLMRAPRLVGKKVFGLPSGTPIPVFPVDCFEKAPKDWVKGAGSYVCPVEPEWGLWFSWTDNPHFDTAVLPSVKGMNPITGKKIESLALERYQEKCPIHDIPFIGDRRFCEKCDYEWPPQNYVCHPNTLWWDGFRAEDGTVRQFFFSADEERDIASAVIGKKNAVPAFGFAFYRARKSRQPKVPKYRDIVAGCDIKTAGGISGYFGGESTKGGGGNTCGPTGLTGLTGLTGPTGPSGPTSESFYYSNSSCTFGGSYVAEEPVCAADDSVCAANAGEPSSGIMRNYTPKELHSRGVRIHRGEVPDLEEKKVSVGGGAKINQNLDPDSMSSLKGWRKRTGGIIRLYFCFEPQFAEIVTGGIRNIKGHKEGYMKGLPVG